MGNDHSSPVASIAFQKSDLSSKQSDTAELLEKGMDVEDMIAMVSKS
jgi:hypothetical protein